MATLREPVSAEGSVIRANKHFYRKLEGLLDA